MHETVDISVQKDILATNRDIAWKNAQVLRESGIYSMDFLGAIGSGKTLLIEDVIDKLKDRGKSCGVIAGDVAGDDDYQRVIMHGVQATSITTGKECHLDAHLIQHTLEDLDLNDLDVLFIENIGNLVCPMDFPLGTDRRVVVVSVTEGDDMVRKHPMIFALADVIVINKIDLAEVMEVDIERIVGDAREVNPNTTLCLTDARHGEGIEDLIAALNIPGLRL
jgi:hydrogenase nickel incorporation protein HypB